MKNMRPVYPAPAPGSGGGADMAGRAHGRAMPEEGMKPRSSSGARGT